MDGRSAHEAQGGVYTVTQFDLEGIFRKLESRGFEQIALESSESTMEQLRFSHNTKDLYNIWREKDLGIFASVGDKSASTVVKDESRIDESIDKLWSVCHKIPGNQSFSGLNPNKQKFGNQFKGKWKEYDLQDLSLALINGSLSNGAERTAGVIYNRYHVVSIKTNYNQCTFETGGVEAVIRSFKGETTGQEGRHFGLACDLDASTLEAMGRDSALPLTLPDTEKTINPGKFRVIMAPYVIGNLISYSSGFLSYYSVESGLSCFSESLGKKVSDENFTLVDDPLDYEGTNARVCDDEGTATRKNVLIENGILKGFMHSHSTASRANTTSTGNAGIISPKAWQMKILPGKVTFDEMLSDLDEGLLINNCWYTRYQDYRNDIFSTVPRDGVFYVKNGEIQGSVRGIRISDSIPSILRNITAVSREVKNVKWWEEISASTMPYVLVNDVNLSKAF
ncbi:MAG: TldD/PmbA family protein [Candidatus Thermoplasmatota archaeon]|nr:TldD/PmbA family protein [Candidatus Thermoplasmatota archaeon]